jgi:ribosome-binding factor A
MSRSHHSGDQPSQRMLRVGELIRHVVSDLLSRGAVNDPVLDGHVISVPEVRMSPDLKLATVYVMPLGGKDVKPVIEALDRNRKFMRGEVAGKCTLRFAPDLRFRVDESFERGSRIDSILASPEVQRDLAVLGDDEDAPEASRH